ncbi:MAG: hypothetical protein KC431_02980, partial [Myxococcales bacterium]|nr:hypothetical protein [Myxococcales bacterium]
GWGRFLPWSVYRRLVAATRLGERPLQGLSLALEVLAPLALLSREAAMLALVIWSAFHLGVLVNGGFWFWDWVGANALLMLALTLLPASFDAALFGWDSVLASTAFIIALPLQNRLWSPISLAWWETPLTQRMHWYVEGESGRRYELYSDYMCPNERLYGKVHACFMAPTPLLTFHLGTVWDPEQRDALAAAGPSRERIDALRERYGVQPRDSRLATNHINYLHRLFASLNAGARKHVLPRGLRWLKAPGGHCYYWGELPGYRGQEPVAKVSLRFVERYFDGEELVTLHDELVTEIDIDESSARRVCVREPSAREMERLLCEAFWRRADGRKPRAVPVIVQQELGSGS